MCNELRSGLSIFSPITYREHLIEDLYINAPFVIAEKVKHIVYRILRAYADMEADRRCGLIRTWDIVSDEDEQHCNEVADSIYAKMRAEADKLLDELYKFVDDPTTNVYDLLEYLPGIITAKECWKHFYIRIALLPDLMGFVAINVPFIGTSYCKGKIVVGQTIFENGCGFMFYSDWNTRKSIFDHKYVDEVGLNWKKFRFSLFAEALYKIFKYIVPIAKTRFEYMVDWRGSEPEYEYRYPYSYIIGFSKINEVL